MWKTGGRGSKVEAWRSIRTKGKKLLGSKFFDFKLTPREIPPDNAICV